MNPQKQKWILTKKTMGNFRSDWSYNYGILPDCEFVSVFY